MPTARKLVEIALSDPVATGEKWKIQDNAGFGQWGDIKVSIDDGPYVDDHYATKEEAEKELSQFPNPESYRVVPASTPSDVDFYS